MQKLVKVVFLILLVFIMGGGFFSYVLTKSFVPWEFIDAINCPLISSSCGLSSKNFNYYYWINKAIKSNNIDLCDNIIGKETYDIEGDSKNWAITDCKVVYIIKTDNLNLCLDSTYRNSCLFGLAKRFKKQDLCEKISEPQDLSFEQRQIKACKDNIENNDDNNLIAY